VAYRSVNPATGEQQSFADQKQIHQSAGHKQAVRVLVQPAMESTTI